MGEFETASGCLELVEFTSSFPMLIVRYLFGNDRCLNVSSVLYTLGYQSKSKRIRDSEIIYLSFPSPRVLVGFLNLDHGLVSWLVGERGGTRGGTD